MKRVVSLSLLLSLALLQGCYTHAEVPLTQVPVGSSVRARVSAAKAEELAPILGREDRVLVGRTIEASGESLLLQVRSLGGTTGRELGQRIQLGGPEIVELELRTLDRTRTYVAVGLLAAVAATVGYMIFAGGEEGGGPDKPGTGVDELRIPIRAR